MFKKNSKFADLFKSENEARIRKWKELGVSRVKADLENNQGRLEVGGSPKSRDITWLWVEYEESKFTFGKFINNPWVIRILGGLLVAFIIWLISNLI